MKLDELLDEYKKENEWVINIENGTKKSGFITTKIKSKKADSEDLSNKKKWGTYEIFSDQTMNNVVRYIVIKKLIEKRKRDWRTILDTKEFEKSKPLESWNIKIEDYKKNISETKEITTEKIKPSYDLEKPKADFELVDAIRYIEKSAEVDKLEHDIKNNNWFIKVKKWDLEKLEDEFLSNNSSVTKKDIDEQNKKVIEEIKSKNKNLDLLNNQIDLINTYIVQLNEMRAKEFQDHYEKNENLKFHSDYFKARLSSANLNRLAHVLVINQNKNYTILNQKITDENNEIIDEMLSNSKNYDQPPNSDEWPVEYRKLKKLTIIEAPKNTHKPSNRYTFKLLRNRIKFTLKALNNTWYKEYLDRRNIWVKQWIKNPSFWLKGFRYQKPKFIWSDVNYENYTFKKLNIDLDVITYGDFFNDTSLFTLYASKDTNYKIKWGLELMSHYLLGLVDNKLSKHFRSIKFLVVIKPIINQCHVARIDDIDYWKWKSLAEKLGINNFDQLWKLRS
ncbi:hypothetical protein ACA758_00470 [Mycoplasmopsis agassizii]|uniref:hypothetical protein n=1 Tax=Mycoplasmopsis agassizii TaxID=33922 RepID=UPI003526D895